MSRTVIQPALNQGIWVLCDRFSDSTRAYQGSARASVAPALLNAMQRVTIGDLKPDLTIILDVPVEVGLQARGRAPRHAARPTGSRRKTSNFIRDCATPTGRSRPTSRSAAC